MSAASGSAGGQVYSRNKGGNYIRARAVPINRRTPKQMAVRASFATNSKAWSAMLTAAQRLAWNFFAASNPTVNALGASIILSGLAMYNKLTQVLSNIGLPPSSSPPVSMTVPALAAPQSVTAVHTGGVITVTTATQSVVAGAEYYVFATPPQAPGRIPPQSAFRFIAVLPAVAAATTLILTTQYAAAFGAFPVGASIGFSIAGVNTASGATTPPLIFNVIAT